MTVQNYIFSAKSNTFYPVELRNTYKAAGTWPKDGVSVDDAVFKEFSGVAPEGKIRAADKSGLPSWVDMPQPSSEELIATAELEKQRLIVVANEVLAPLSDAVDLNIATDGERQLYDAWRRYRIFLTRVDTAITPVVWPESPLV